MFVLSSDPDEVIGKLRAFAADKDTSATILRLADVVRQQSANEVVEAEKKAESSRRLDALVARQLDGAIERLGEGSLSRDALLQEAQALRILVETVP